MADEGVHEIQLKGKQLVFLFMAATVVAGVIFLCGVMVGRGVPTRAASTIDTPEQVSFDTRGAAQELALVRAVSSDGSAPVTAQETLTYASLLEDPYPLAETLAPAAEPVSAVPEPVVDAQPAPATPPLAAVNPSGVAAAPTPTPILTTESGPAPVAPPAPPPAVALATEIATAVADATLAEPPGTGFVVQVAAVRQRDAANAMARRLSAKGYPAFVTIAGPNFRVRVGKYNDRSEAESVAGRLEKEERFKPWITR